MGQDNRGRTVGVGAPRSSFPTLVYALGEGANSLVMNGVLAFAMLYYTKALGLDPFWAGVAMSASMFWEAISEPLMGHISDNTRSRWGRRHPYMLAGGLLMAVCCYLICAVPAAFRAGPWWTFWYLVDMARLSGKQIERQSAAPLHLLWPSRAAPVEFPG